jgi:hypothetical protein
MITSRLRQLKEAKRLFDRAVEYSHDQIDDATKPLLDLIVDIAADDPLPINHECYKVEIYLAQTIAIELFKRFTLLIHLHDRFSDIYKIIGDPAVLSSPILRAMVDNEERYKAARLQMLEEALTQGGIIAADSFPNLRELINPDATRALYRLPSARHFKQLLENHVRNEWAVDLQEEFAYNYSVCIAYLVGCVGDLDPDWAVDFTHEHQHFLNRVFTKHFIQVDSDDLRPLAGCLNTVATPKMIVALSHKNPDLYETLMRSSFFLHHLTNKIKANDGYKLTDLPTHRVLGQVDVVKLLVELVRADSLTESRFEDLQAFWEKSGFSGSLLGEARDFPEFNELFDAIKIFKAFLNREDLTPEILKKEGRVYPFTGKNFPFVDSLLFGREAQMASSFRLVDAYTALTIARKPKLFSPQNVERLGVLVIGMAIQEVKADKWNTLMEETVLKAFQDKANHPEVAKLSASQVDDALACVKKIDKRVLRQINWLDRTIKGRMIEEDLGM